MPLYDYKCANGHIFELLQSWSSDRVATCAECGESAKRQMSVPMVLYKGSGFYTTDYARNGSSNGSSNGSGESDSKRNGEAKSSKDSDSSKTSDSSKKETAANSASK